MYNLNEMPCIYKTCSQYFSDLNNCIKYSKLYEFADDTVLIKIIKNISDREELHDLNNISK